MLFLRGYLLVFCDRIFLSVWSLLSRLDWLVSEPQGFTCLRRQCWIISVHHLIHSNLLHRFQGSNSAPHNAKAVVYQQSYLVSPAVASYSVAPFSSSLFPLQATRQTSLSFGISVLQKTWKLFPLGNCIVIPYSPVFT